MKPINEYIKQFDPINVLKYFIKWFLLVIPVSIIVGSLVALFLFLLDFATQTRWQNPWLIYLLPFAGIAIVALYKFKGKNAEAGNNLVMDEIHKPGGGIPFRMAPFVLFTTVATHLFGGSAGREGTAVQIGGSMASFIAKRLHLNPDDFRIMLMTGVAAGFGAVFGTPVAGTIFALEVLAIGRIKYDALLPCFLSAIMAHFICTWLGITHTHYAVNYTNLLPTIIPGINLSVLLMVIVAGVAFGLASRLFSVLSHFIKNISSKYIKRKLLIPFAGGCIIIGLSLIPGNSDYLGLGVSSANGDGTNILNAFKPGGVNSIGWLWKIIFTTITLSTGFKGGEVTPLFFIGATLGNTIAMATNMPVDLFAAVGFVAVFAGATNTPLACTFMGVELFGGQYVLYFAVACFVAYYFSGHTGIYQSQRVNVAKGGLTNNAGQNSTLKSIYDINHNNKP